VEFLTKLLSITDEAPKDQLSYFDFLAAEEGDVNAPVESYFKLEHLDLEIKTKLIAVLRKNESCILTKGKKLGCTHLIEHKVALQPGTKPIARPPYRIPQIHEAEVDSLIQEMVNDEIIEECSSPWAAPMLIVRRTLPDGTIKIRPCVHYRHLNKSCISDNFPMPSITELLDTLGGNSVFSVIDINSAFWQIRTDFTTSLVYSFRTPKAQYRMLKLPFGAMNSLATWLRLWIKC